MAVGDDHRGYSSASKASFIIGGIAAHRFHGWGRPVHAPFAGEVVRVSDGWLDRETASLLRTVGIWAHATFLFRPARAGTEIDIRPNVGNYIMLRHPSGVVAFLAHLRSGSVRTRLGQCVVAGEPLAEVGSSGNSTAPHLHLNLFDQVDDLLRAQVVPFVLSRYDQWDGIRWTPIENRLPDKGDIVTRGSDF